MNNTKWLVYTAVLAFLLAMCGCQKKTDSSPDEHGHSHENGQSHSHSNEGNGPGEHEQDSQEHAAQAGEESGTQLSLTEAYNATRNGAQLYLAFNPENNSFEGWVTNNTRETLKQVRVEVHLSNGSELGPTTPTDLTPGQQMDVKLTATSEGFTGWTAHPEVGSSEHSHGENGHEHNEQGEHI